MRYQKSLQAFAVGCGAACVWRVALKVLVVDIQTGFYPASSLFTMGFSLLMGLVPAAILFFAWREKGAGPARLKGSLGLQVLALGVGLSLAWRSGMLLLPAGGGAPSVMDWVRALLGGAAAVCMLYFAWRHLGGATGRPCSLAVGMVPILWQCVDGVVQFFGFLQPLTCSDQTLETLLIAAGCLFWLYHGAIICGAGLPRAGTKAVVAGLCCAFWGIPLVAGQAAAWLVLGPLGSGPDLAQGVYILWLSGYGVWFSAALARAPREAL